MSKTLDTQLFQPPIKGAQACNQQGISCVAYQEFQDACAHFEEAIRLKPDYAIAHNNLGNALYSQGNYDRAMASYQQALVYHPEYLEACNNLATTLVTVHRIDSNRGQGCPVR